ncbi:MAG: hypothetical protein KC594_13310 [Nitrospira sp.]|nr:hypothetical protein [Nitrospira sp.]
MSMRIFIRVISQILNMIYLAHAPHHIAELAHKALAPDAGAGTQSLLIATSVVLAHHGFHTFKKLVTGILKWASRNR